MSRRKGEPVHGWLILDKPEGVTSTQAVAICRRKFNAQKAGTGGTPIRWPRASFPSRSGKRPRRLATLMEADKDYVFTSALGDIGPRRRTARARLQGTSDVRPGARRDRGKRSSASSARSNRCRRSSLQ